MLVVLLTTAPLLLPLLLLSLRNLLEVTRSSAIMSAMSMVEPLLFL